METQAKTPEETEAVRALLRPYLRVAAKIEAIAACPWMTADLVGKVCRDFDRRRASPGEWIGVERLIDNLREAREWAKRFAVQADHESAVKADAIAIAPGRYAASFFKKVALLASFGIRGEVATELANKTADTHSTTMLAEAIDQIDSKLPGVIVAGLRKLEAATARPVPTVSGAAPRPMDPAIRRRWDAEHTSVRRSLGWCEEQAAESGRAA
jgi:hypothetical protein